MVSIRTTGLEAAQKRNQALVSIREKSWYLKENVDVSSRSNGNGSKELLNAKEIYSNALKDLKSANDSLSKVAGIKGIIIKVVNWKLRKRLNTDIKVIELSLKTLDIKYNFVVRVEKTTKEYHQKIDGLNEQIKQKDERMQEIDKTLIEIRRKINKLDGKSLYTESELINNKNYLEKMQKPSLFFRASSDAILNQIAKIDEIAKRDLKIKNKLNENKKLLIDLENEKNQHYNDQKSLLKELSPLPSELRGIRWQAFVQWTSGDLEDMSNLEKMGVK